MKRMLINATQDEVRVAIVDGARLIDLDIERPDLQQKKSNIYKGKISSIEPSLGAVFVDYDDGRHGFLPLKEISREYFLSEPTPNQPVAINKVLRVGQELVVQVEKEERGTKGAALTTFISLAGSYLVLMPNSPKAGGISRRIDGEERDHLRDALSKIEVPEGMGIIIRTAGVGRSAEELNWDLQVLLRYWEAIKQAAVARPGLTYLIHQESDVIIRGIRDYLREDINEVIIDQADAFKSARNYIAQIRPDFVERIKHYEDPMPLFSRFHIEQQIESAYQREVQLPSGGSIVIDHSEALVAIDINSARATKGSGIEETALNTNLEAAEEIGRQLRIRDIGGLIVIDFIDMTPSQNQRSVENRLRAALKQDRARIQVGRISRFGLLEMSRQRLRTSLRKSTRITCPRCDGQGAIRTVESIAASVIHLLQEQSLRDDNNQLQIQLPIDVATFILNEKRSEINAIEKHTQAEIVVIPNPYMHSPQYNLKQAQIDPNKQPISYKLVKIPKTESASAKRTSITKIPEPAITQFLANPTNKAVPKHPSSPGIIKRLWDAMFGSDDATEITPPVPPTPQKSSRSEHTSRHKGHGTPRKQGNKPRSGNTSRQQERTTPSSRGQRSQSSSGRKPKQAASQQTSEQKWQQSSDQQVMSADSQRQSKASRQQPAKTDSSAANKSGQPQATKTDLRAKTQPSQQQQAQKDQSASGKSTQQQPAKADRQTQAKTAQQQPIKTDHPHIQSDQQPTTSGQLAQTDTTKQPPSKTDKQTRATQQQQPPKVDQPAQAETVKHQPLKTDKQTQTRKADQTKQQQPTSSEKLTQSQTAQQPIKTDKQTQLKSDQQQLAQDKPAQQQDKVSGKQQQQDKPTQAASSTKPEIVTEQPGKASIDKYIAKDFGHTEKKSSAPLQQVTTKAVKTERKEDTKKPAKTKQTATDSSTIPEDEA